MKRDDWYSSVKFLKLRLMNNIAAEIGFKLQQLQDVYEILVQEHADMVVSDKFRIAERQLRINRLEANNLESALRNLDRFFTPKFDDLMFTQDPPSNPDELPQTAV